MKKKNYTPPSKIKYDQNHPTVSIRVTKELYQELNELRQLGDRSLGDILREALKSQVLSTNNLDQGVRHSAGDKYDVNPDVIPVVDVNEIKETAVETEMEYKLQSTDEKGKNSRRINRREEIIRTAAKLFADKGYHRVSLDEVAKQMHITKPALYQYICSKEEILQEICKTCFVNAFDKWKQIDTSNFTPTEKLRLYIKTVVFSVIRERDLMVVLFEDSSALNDDVQTIVRRQRKVHDEELESILREGVNKGYFRIPDIKLAVYSIYGTCMWIYQWYRPEGRLSPEQIADGIICLFEKGYLPGSD